MSRRNIAVFLILAAGCKSVPAPANQMAPTAPVQPQAKLPEAAKPAPLPAPPPVSNDGIAARINNEIITWKDVRDVLKEIKPADLTPELKKSKLREMAEERMFLQAAKKNNLSITEQELDEAQRRDVKMYGSDEEFEKVIRIKFGTKTAYREDKRKTLLIFKLYRHLLQQSWTNPTKDTPGLMLDFVSPQEIREYYKSHETQFQAIEQVAFTRIGLQFSTTREEEVKQQVAESLVRKLEEGAEFTMLAYFYSDVTRAKSFRDRGVSRQDLSAFYTPETVHYLFDTMKEGEISGIIKDGKTLNIFKMEQKFAQKQETFDEAQIKIRSMLENQYREENRKKLRDHLRKESYLWPNDLFDND
ncbi:MAG TPA: peptidyl-prolyl cis-trans isomerase [Planctomycetota bacterium]|nr:peptidyl-prolyl cis-trans isomerase [Planctomycetota bacterium]